MVKLGIIHYNAPGDTLAEFLDYVKETGFGYVELQIRDVWPDESQEPGDAPEIARTLLEERGLKASALSAGNDFVLLEQAQIARQVARMKRICELAQMVGTDTIRTEGGQPKESVPQEKWAEAMAGCLTRCLEFVVPMGIKLAVDNHGLVTNDGDVQIKTLELVGSDNVGANLDTMNYRWFGHSLETIDRYYERIAPWVKHTHLKDGTGSRQNYVGASLGKGEINLRHAIDCCVRAGYSGVWCAEWEGRGDKGVGYAECLAWMRENCPET
ncbi:MAG: sugar phosphate isomerase/epimerase family protein [Candidatus Zipacnadales bacterium]